VGPKRVEIRQYINKIEIVTSVGLYSICLKDARYKKLKTVVSVIILWDHRRIFGPKRRYAAHDCIKVF